VVTLKAKPGDDSFGNRSGVGMVPKALPPVDVADMHFYGGNFRAA